MTVHQVAGKQKATNGFDLKRLKIEALSCVEALRIVLKYRFGLCESSPPVEPKLLDVIRTQSPLRHRRARSFVKKHPRTS